MSKAKPRATAYFLAKTEPDAFSIDDLRRDGEAPWDGVRNFQARNVMRDGMRKGDLVLIYHSSCEPPGVVGLAEVIDEAHPDPSQFDRKSKYHDPKSKPDAPRWLMVRVRFQEKFPRMVTLAELKADPELEGMIVTRRGSRLSVMPVEREHFMHVCMLAGSTSVATRRPRKR